MYQRFMLKFLYVSFPDPSPAISAQFTFKICVAIRNRKENY